MEIPKFPKIKYPNDPETDGLGAKDVVVLEKYDGANFRFTWTDDGELHIGTRNHTFHHDSDDLPKAFQHAVDYLLDVTEDYKIGGGWMSDLVFYGEAMHRHSLDYEAIDWQQPHKGSPHVPLDSLLPNVVVFDAYRLGERGDKGAGWVHYDEFLDIMQHSPFSAARELDRGPLDEVDTSIPEESDFGGPPEGIVVRREDGGVRAKKVSEDFKEAKHQAIDKAASDAAVFVEQYLTDARIEKQAHKLVDEGEYDHVAMEMMEQLPRRALVDAMHENAWDLLTEFETEWDDDFKGEVRSKASTKCARVLKSMVQDF